MKASGRVTGRSRIQEEKGQRKRGRAEASSESAGESSDEVVKVEC